MEHDRKRADEEEKIIANLSHFNNCVGYLYENTILLILIEMRGIVVTCERHNNVSNEEQRGRSDGRFCKNIFNGRVLSDNTSYNYYIILYCLSVFQFKVLSLKLALRDDWKIVGSSMNFS